MIEERFILTSDAFSGEIELVFSLNGHLTKFMNRAELNEKQIFFFSANFPMTVAAANELLGRAKNIKAVHFPAELDFEAFWKKYNLKVDKEKARIQWDRLSEKDKLQAYLSIDEYDKFLVRKVNQDKIYACRYIERRRFDVDYKALK